MLAEQVLETNFDKLLTSPFAAELTPNECAVLANKMELRNLSLGERLLAEGDQGDSLFIVVSGQLAVVKNNSGYDEILEYVQPGGVAGIMGFIDGEAHSASLVAVGDVELLSLRSGVLWSLLEQHPRLVFAVFRSLMRIVHRIIRNMNDQYVQMTNYINKRGGRY